LKKTSCSGYALPESLKNGHRESPHPGKIPKNVKNAVRGLDIIFKQVYIKVS
jgi:hypothetical protein